MSSITNFLTQTEIEANDPHLAEIYKNMQGNILKGHGRDHATMIFLNFQQKDRTSTRKALKKFAVEHVTSFYKQLWERERFKRNKVPGGIFGGLFITQKGYEYLQEEPLLKDEAFLAGMKARTALNDPPVPRGSGYYRTIHVMLLLADDDKDRMDIAAGKVIEEMDKVATILHVEYGDSIRNANGDGLEHNGYVDGVSQPLFLKDEVEEYKKQHGINKESDFKFDPRKTPGLVLLQDPYVKDREGVYGSYFVFRKLEQRVKAFKKEESGIGKAVYGKDAEERERAGAMLVGRFEDGTPIKIQGEDKLIGSGAFNNFNYDQISNYDPSDGRCPHFAHIRKTNPRLKDAENNYKFDDHTMARRGIPFGHRNVNTELPEIHDDQLPIDGVGLLFMSYQQSIKTQFEVIQGRANNAGNGGVDPVIGQNEPRPKYNFPNDPEVKDPTKLTQDFHQHIHFKGGEYFFAPSMVYLDKLIS